MDEPLGGSVDGKNSSPRFLDRFRSSHSELRVLLTRRMHSAITVSVKVESSLAILVAYGVLGGAVALMLR